MYKRYLSLLLCCIMLVLLFSVGIIAFAEDAEPETFMVGVISEPGDNKVGVNVRDDAGTSANRVDNIAHGTTVNVIGSKNDIADTVNTSTNQVYIWYQISYIKSGTTYTGYVREDLIVVTTYTIDKSYEEQLKDFPESYHPYLNALHAQYPNWVFQADKIDMTFQEAIALESVNYRKLVMNQDISWRSMENGYYNWNTGVFAGTDGGNRYAASREVIAYYMDPRNFLDSNNVYIFMKQKYSSDAQTIDGVRQIIKGSFLETNYYDPNDIQYSVINNPSNQSEGVKIYKDAGDTAELLDSLLHGTDITITETKQDINGALNPSANQPYNWYAITYQKDGSTLNGYVRSDFTATDYAKVIMEAARQSTVDPYFLASTIIQEQGTSGTKFTNGSVKYNDTVVYNFFNFSVSGSTEADKEQNGAKYAYNNGWTTRSASIIGGAVKYANDYLNRGNNQTPANPFYNQDTYFYKNYNILNKSDIWHQYAQNVADSVSSASKLKSLYSTDYQAALIFRIPVYKNDSLPKSTISMPAKNSNKNNYYLNLIEVDGLTPSFSRYVYSYSLQISKDTEIYVELPQGAKLTSEMSFDLSEGQNDISLTVMSETGYTNDYVININAIAPATLTVTTEKSETPPTDPDEGGGEEGGEQGGGVTPEPEPEPPNPVIKNGDANNDGVISVSDLAAVRLHILNLNILSGDKLTGADANGDGKVSVSDLAAIRLHILEIKLLD